MFPDDFLMISSHFPSSSSSRSPWSRSQDKLFEQAIAIFPDGTPDRWRKIACHVPGKTPWEIREHYEALVHDVLEIDSGRVELPRYEDDDSFSPSWASECGSRTNQIEFGSKSKHTEMERKKGVPWTEEEHKLFLIGLQRYGKGDWRSISRNAVVSRTPTQVASHAQKYYLRLNSMKKEKTKRSSIHDITTVDTCSVSPPPPNDQTRVGVGPSSNGSNSIQHETGTKMGPPKSRSFLDQGCSSSGYQHLGFPM
ncbi:SANT/Myb domain [Macleaya cordata]|uniref:SANT/Myb domain n=1 Tax=Macleaya cordata TaxID=56857 RepID=A0A200QHX0_MACCD|nr:SANT/Myb domain [Macleaya cordata]